MSTISDAVSSLEGSAIPATLLPVDPTITPSDTDQTLTSTETRITSIFTATVTESTLPSLSMEKIMVEIERINKRLSEFDSFNSLTAEKKMVFSLYFINCCQGLFTAETTFITEFSHTFEQEVITYLHRFFKTGKLAYFPSDNIDASACATFMYIAMTKDLLIVETTSSEILDTYINFNKLILLRPLISDTLILGCGLGRCRSDCTNPTLKSYFHDGLDTIDMSLDMNPSALCFWGNDAQTQFFKDRYLAIYDEGPIISFIQDKDSFWNSCTVSLNKDSSTSPIVVIASHIFEPELAPKDANYSPAIDTKKAHYCHRPKVYNYKK